MKIPKNTGIAVDDNKPSIPSVKFVALVAPTNAKAKIGTTNTPKNTNLFIKGIIKYPMLSFKR